jgi:DNA helicase II / ATP-dependent DNA helicase PcrA
MSVTHLRNYLECPRRFYVRNILHVPEVRSVHQALGTAVHEALRAFLQKYQHEGQVPAKEWLVTTFVEYVRRELLSETEARDVEDIGRKTLEAYFDRYATDFEIQAMSEFDFSSHGVRIGEAAITGTLDKIEWLDADKKTVNVVDYKTGQPENKMRAVKPGGVYHQQLVFYKLLCDYSPRFPYEMISGEIDFVQPTRTGKFVKQKITVTDQDTKQLVDSIQEVWADIHAHAFLDPTTWCGKCEYCVSA